MSVFKYQMAILEIHFTSYHKEAGFDWCVVVIFTFHRHLLQVPFPFYDFQMVTYIPQLISILHILIINDFDKCSLYFQADFEK